MSTTLLPIRSPIFTTRQTSNSNLKRRHDNSPQSPTKDSFVDTKRRRSPVHLPGADTYMNLSSLGPPTFESKNPRFTPMGSLSTGTYGYHSTASIIQSMQPQRSLATAMESSLRSANPHATPMNTPTQSFEDVDMMDMEMDDTSIPPAQSGRGEGNSGVQQHQTVRSRDTTPKSEQVNEETGEMLKKGKLKLVIGYRADCGRCQRREPGHSAHFVSSN